MSAYSEWGDEDYCGLLVGGDVSKIMCTGKLDSLESSCGQALDLDSSITVQCQKSVQ